MHRSYYAVHPRELASGPWGCVVQYEQLNFLMRDHLSFSPRSLIHPCQRLREELKEIALKKCDESVAKFAVCAKEKGMWVVFSCREQNRQSESPPHRKEKQQQTRSECHRQLDSAIRTEHGLSGGLLLPRLPFVWHNNSSSVFNSVVFIGDYNDSRLLTKGVFLVDAMCDCTGRAVFLLDREDSMSSKTAVVQ